MALDSLRAAYEVSEINNEVRLAFAWFLNRHGDQEGATEIVARLRHIRFDPLRDSHSWGFSDVTYTVRLRWLQEALGVPEGAVPGATDVRQEEYVRVEKTARHIGSLLARAEKEQVQVTAILCFDRFYYSITDPCTLNRWVHTIILFCRRHGTQYMNRLRQSRQQWASAGSARCVTLCWI